MRSVTRLSTTLGALALAFAATSAHAGGFTTTRFGGEGGHAATNDVTAIFYNPAGLAYGKGTRAYVEGLFAYRTVDYNRDPGAIDDAGGDGSGTPADGVAANSGKATLANGVVSPFIGIATDAGIRGLGVGFALSVPFGGQASWDTVEQFKNDPKYPGGYDSSARWASIEGSQRAIYYTLAAGWRTRDGSFGVGAGLNVVSSEISLVRARNLDGTDDLLQPSGAIKEGRALLDVKALNLAASFGLMWKPNECSRLGISYHSQPGFGEQTLEGQLTTQLGATAPGTIDIELRQSLPDSLRLGGEWRALDKVSFHFAIDYQRWSKFRNQCIVNPGAPASACAANTDGIVADNSDVNANIVRAWKDTYGVRVGGAYHASEALEINAGLLFDSNAVPDKTLDPALIDQNKLIPQLGVRYLANRFLISATLGNVFYFSRTTAPRTEVPAGKNRSPDMAGDYKQSVSYLLFGVGVAL